MKMTPLFIELALHYYTTPGEHPSVENRAQAYVEARNQMVQFGLILHDGFGNYVTSEGMKLYVDTLCSVPIPVQRWVIPNETTNPR